MLKLAGTVKQGDEFIYYNLDGTVKMLKLAGTVEQGDEEKLNQTLSRIINKKNVPNFAELKVEHQNFLVYAFWSSPHPTINFVHGSHM